MCASAFFRGVLGWKYQETRVKVTHALLDASINVLWPAFISGATTLCKLKASFKRSPKCVITHNLQRPAVFLSSPLWGVCSRAAVSSISPHIWSQKSSWCEKEQTHRNIGSPLLMWRVKGHRCCAARVGLPWATPGGSLWCQGIDIETDWTGRRGAPLQLSHTSVPYEHRYDINPNSITDLNPKKVWSIMMYENKGLRVCVWQSGEAHGWFMGPRFLGVSLTHTYTLSLSFTLTPTWSDIIWPIWQPNWSSTSLHMW